MRISGSPIASQLSNHTGVRISREGACCSPPSWRSGITRCGGLQLLPHGCGVRRGCTSTNEGACSTGLVQVYFESRRRCSARFIEVALQMQVTTNGLEQRVQDLEEAERKAGFRPYLPSPGVLHADSGITITGPTSVEQTIHVRDIETALVKVAASDVQVPAEWEGVQLRTQIGPMVELNYPDGVHIVQTRPIELSIPSGFPLEQFAEVAFRSIGVSSWEARAIAQRFAANPAWLLDLPPDAVVSIQEVSLHAGPAMLIEETNDRGEVTRVTVVRSTSERMYSVSSGNRERSMKIADALP
jgi:hypothetical protein